MSNYANSADLLRRASLAGGLSPSESALLLREESGEFRLKILQAASQLTRERFQSRISFFAPLYFSNFCVNDCAYCAYRINNEGIDRRKLSVDEFLREAESLWEAGHRTLLLVAGEHFRLAGPEVLLEYLRALKQTNLQFEIGVEVAPLRIEDYRRLKENGVSRVVLYQETYDSDIYKKLHKKGPKSLFLKRYSAIQKAMSAGIEKPGLGVLLGLADYRTEIPMLIEHYQLLAYLFGRAPYSVSFPRLRNAPGTEFPDNGFSVGDDAYEMILAVTRLALPDAAMVVSTRESPEMRRKLMKKGLVTHMSAGVSTQPGGYTCSEEEIEARQFSITDHRSAAEVFADAASLGYTVLTR